MTEPKLKKAKCYLDPIFSKKLYSSLIGKRLFPNTKEFTESMGILNACLKIAEFKGYKRGENKLTVVIVGDRKRPRTGALIASDTNWNVISIDPNFTTESTFDVVRLKVYKSKIEDMKELYFKGPIIICFPHSHANIDQALLKLKSEERHIISMPCCFQDGIGDADLNYTDESVMSEKNKINLYLNI